MMPDRKSNRLKGYDYASAGCYFVTVCVNKKPSVPSTLVGAGSHARPCPDVAGPCPDARGVHVHQNVFGDIEHGVMKLNDVGRMIERVWREIPEYYDGIDIDPNYAVMPDHFHGIVIIDHDVLCAREPGRAAREPGRAAREPGRAWEPAPTTVRGKGMTLSDVMQRFKSLTTTLYCRDFISNDPLSRRVCLWQRSYYDRIIRDGREHVMTREYIFNNAAQWASDEENPVISKG